MTACKDVQKDAKKGTLGVMMHGLITSGIRKPVHRCRVNSVSS